MPRQFVFHFVLRHSASCPPSSASFFPQHPFALGVGVMVPASDKAPDSRRSSGQLSRPQSASQQYTDDEDAELLGDSEGPRPADLPTSDPGQEASRLLPPPPWQVCTYPEKPENLSGFHPENCLVLRCCQFVMIENQHNKKLHSVV